jgi:hypothetical protein
MCIGQRKREGTEIKCWGPKVETKKTMKNRIEVEVRRMKK